MYFTDRFESDNEVSSDEDGEKVEWPALSQPIRIAPKSHSSRDILSPSSRRRQLSAASTQSCISNDSDESSVLSLPSTPQVKFG